MSLFYIIFKNAINFPLRKGHRIYDQLKRMGVSTDWDRESFTMNEVGFDPSQGPSQLFQGDGCGLFKSSVPVSFEFEVSLLSLTCLSFSRNSLELLLKVSSDCMMKV